MIWSYLIFCSDLYFTTEKQTKDDAYASKSSLVIKNVSKRLNFSGGQDEGLEVTVANLLRMNKFNKVPSGPARCNEDDKDEPEGYEELIRGKLRKSARQEARKKTAVANDKELDKTRTDNVSGRPKRSVRTRKDANFSYCDRKKKHKT